MIVNSNSQTSGVQNESADSDTSFQAAGDFNTFLKLLTAQMRNQDPLQPMESTEFVAQLASFSAVEQQIQTNEKLDRLINLFSASTDTGLAEWIGKEIRTSNPVDYNGSPLEIELNVSPTMTSARFVVESSDGTTIYEQTIDPSDQTIIWRGEAFDPEIVAPSGSYSFAVVSFDADNNLSKILAEVVSPIAEIRKTDGELVFVLENGNSVSLSDMIF